jgi:hypothetical protein
LEVFCTVLQYTGQPGCISCGGVNSWGYVFRIKVEGNFNFVRACQIYLAREQNIKLFQEEE